jgi:hypothetical protein
MVVLEMIRNKKKRRRYNAIRDISLSLYTKSTVQLKIFRYRSISLCQSSMCNTAKIVSDKDKISFIESDDPISVEFCILYERVI